MHIGHCCRWHGCKYDNKLCPVILQNKEQDYPCELCLSDWDDYLSKTYDQDWLKYMKGNYEQS